LVLLGQKEIDIENAFSRIPYFERIRLPHAQQPPLRSDEEMITDRANIICERYSAIPEERNALDAEVATNFKLDKVMWSDTGYSASLEVLKNIDEQGGVIIGLLDYKLGLFYGDSTVDITNKIVKTIKDYGFSNIAEKMKVFDQIKNDYHFQFNESDREQKLSQSTKEIIQNLKSAFNQNNNFKAAMASIYTDYMYKKFDIENAFHMFKRK
jgi:hypothetical protein